MKEKTRESRHNHLGIHYVESLVVCAVQISYGNGQVGDLVSILFVINTRACWPLRKLNIIQTTLKTNIHFSPSISIAFIIQRFLTINVDTVIIWLNTYYLTVNSLINVCIITFKLLDHHQTWNIIILMLNERLISHFVYWIIRIQFNKPRRRRRLCSNILYLWVLNHAYIPIISLYIIIVFQIVNTIWVSKSIIFHNCASIRVNKSKRFDK